MKCQRIFSSKNKKNIINLSSTEFAQRVVMVKSLSKIVADDVLIFFFFFLLFRENSLDILCKLSALT